MKDLELCIACICENGDLRSWYSFDYDSCYKFLDFYVLSLPEAYSRMIKFAYCEKWCIPVPDDYNVTTAQALYEDVMFGDVQSPAVKKCRLDRMYRLEYEYIKGEDPFFMH